MRCSCCTAFKGLRRWVVPQLPPPPLPRACHHPFFDLSPPTPPCPCSLMSLSAPEGQASLVFASVFVVVWAGAAVVTFNAKLLGGNISFFQSVCVLGYCVCPLVIAAVLCFLWSSGTGSSIWKAVNVILGTLWSTRASIVFMSELVPDDRRALAVYPVILFYIVIAWMVAIQ